MIVATLGMGALLSNPIAAPLFGAGLANMAHRITQSSSSTDQAIRAGTAAGSLALGGANVAVGGALGAGQLALGAGDLAVRAGGGFAKPAAAVAGGSGYAVALPDAPGAATRGMDGISAEQFQEYMRQTHATASEEVRRAYMQGGMDMHGYYQQQAGVRVPEGNPRVLGPAIRDTPAQGTGTLPRPPVARRRNVATSLDDGRTSSPRLNHNQPRTQE